MEPCIPLPLDPTVLADIVDKAIDWALLHGVGMRFRDTYAKESISFAPFLLIPSSFPRTEFERSLTLQTLMNELIHNVAHDYDFLRRTLSRTCKADKFTGKLFEIYETVRAEGVAQEVSLGLLRSDYFFDEPRKSVKQVEINTIASSFSALSSVLVDAHRYILSELGYNDKLKHLPENKALQGLCGGMLKALSLYGRESAAILFLVEDVTYNICDQRFHEFEIRKMNPAVRVIRKSLTDIGTRAKLDEDKRLFIDEIEIGVIYFRSGYSPDQYHSNLEWDARLLMERSLAIKCPSIHYHLAGCKKVQQELTSPGIIEKYIKSSEDVAAIRAVFTGLFALDRNDAGDKAINMALSNPINYVLKPQREGGGNNIYGEDIKDFLPTIQDSDERNAWILMDRINPPLQHNYMIRPTLKEPLFTEVVSELGIFGVVIGDSKNIFHNEVAGHMLRTKVCSANEGGVASGMGALDSVYLYES